MTKFKSGISKNGKVIKLLIEGDPKTKKNNAQIVGGRIPRLIPSKISMKYEREGSKQLREILKSEEFKDFEIIDTPVNVKTVFYRETKRKVDISNLISAIHDILQVAGILEDDDWSVIESIDGSRVRYDKENPRTEITITLYDEEDNTLVNQIDRIEKKEEEEKKRRREKREEERRQKMKRAHELRGEGLTYREIGDKIGVSSSTASKYTKEYDEMIKEEERRG